MSVKYLEVRDHLRRRVLGMQVGDLLPPEHMLCDEYGVSRITLRKAIDGLVEEELLVREQGRGTFVSQPIHPHRYSESFHEHIGGFYSEMADQGHTVESTVLRQQAGTATPEVAERLDREPAVQVVDLVRVRRVDGAPNHVVHTFLPVDRFPGVAEHDFSTGSLYEYLRAEYDAVLARAHLIVSIGEATEEESEHLGLEIGAPLLVVESTVYDAGGTPMLYGYSRLRPDVNQVEFEVVARHGAAQEGNRP